jgi:hypothetical protein
VPLEKNTVRSVENFSTGKRGAASAEYVQFMPQHHAASCRQAKVVGGFETRIAEHVPAASPPADTS